MVTSPLHEAYLGRKAWPSAYQIASFSLCAIRRPSRRHRLATNPISVSSHSPICSALAGMRLGCVASVNWLHSLPNVTAAKALHYQTTYRKYASVNALWAFYRRLIGEHAAFMPGDQPGRHGNRNGWSFLWKSSWNISELEGGKSLY